MLSEFLVSAVLLWIAAFSQSSDAIPLSREESFFDTPPESLSQAIQKTRRNPLVCITSADSVSGTSATFPGEIQAGQRKRNPKRPSAGNSAKIVDGVLTVPTWGSQQPEEASATSTMVPNTKRRLAPQKAVTKADMTPPVMTPEPIAISTLPPFVDFSATDGVVIIMPADVSPATDGVIGITAQGSQQQEETTAVPNPDIAPETKRPLTSQVGLVRRPTRPKPTTTTALPSFVDFGSTGGLIVVTPSGSDGSDKQLGSGMNMDTNFNPTVNFTSNGQGAATGDANADSASILGSQQVSNMQNTDQGSAVQTGSRGTGTGSNVQLSGSSQAKSNGVSLNVKQLIAVRTRDGNIIFVPVDAAQNAQSDMTPTPVGTFEGQTFQSSGDSAASGSGTVGTGSVTSDQDSQIITNAQGTKSQSINSGSGDGKEIRVKGAAVSGSEGQGSQQTNQWTGNGQRVTNSQQGGNTDGQQEFNSNGKGGATGEAFSPDGSASSVQNSRTVTNDRGTSVQSSSRSRASGKGVRINGASNSGGNQGFMTFRPSFVNFQYRNPWIF